MKTKAHLPTLRATFAAMIAIAGLALCPAAYADDDDDWGDDPGDEPGMDEPMPGDPGYCDWFGHEWTVEEHFAPTCDMDGCDRVHCNNCGMDDEINFVPALGHNYVNGRCTRCGVEGSTTYVYVPAVAPTCTKSGHVAYLVDSDTNYYYDPVNTNRIEWYAIYLPALDHDYVAGTPVLPTCTTQGYTPYVCSRCNASETQAIPALGHDFVAGTPVPPTCTTQGYTPYACSRCNAAENRDVVSALGHAWTAWTTNTPPTCTAAGSETHSCTRCNETETPQIPALGHDYNAWSTNVLPTCTSSGSEGSLCTRCGTGETRAIPALGHDWTAWTVVTPATYTAFGEEAHDCSRCNAHETRALAVLWHSSFSVTSSTSGSTTKFIVTRSGEGTNAAETVRYRTVSLSAYPGQHFTSKSGTLTFAAGQTVLTNFVTVTSPSAAAYKFQTGSNRSYRFDLTDEGGFPITNAVRTITTGTSVSSSNAFGSKNLTVNDGTITVTDGGYDQAYHSVTVNNYFTAAAPKDYLVAAGAQLRATVTFHAREKDDGYQYVAIYANTSTSYVDTGAKDGDPGTISYSRYMAGFTIDGNVSSTYYPYTFPLTSKGDSCGAQTHPWSGNSNGNLQQQYFNTNCRATDGRLIIPTDLSNLYIRFNASGNLNDTWYASNVVAHVQAVDSTQPTLYGGNVNAISVSPGPHRRGNEFYISVPFSEIVNSAGSKTLRTTWGAMDYHSGDGSNVITFKGTVNAADGTTLAITNCPCTFKDLKDNYFQGSPNKTFSGTTVSASYAYPISYNLDGGTLPSNAPTTYTYDATTTLVQPTRTGYTFDGWTGANGSTPKKSVSISAGSHGPRAYIAHWTPITYTVHFDAHDADTGTMPDQSFTYDVTTNLDANAFTRAGYAFAGWSGAGATFADGAAVLNLTNESATVTLTATWVSLWEVLQRQLDAGGTVTLMNDVTAMAGDSSLTITNAVTLDLNGHMLTHNGNGWGINVENGGDLALTNSVEETGAVTGGGVHVAQGGTFTMTGGTISGNTASSGGGVFIARSGTFTMTGGEIFGNTASSGGGVYMDSGMFTMTGGTISGNTASYGGGVYMTGGTFTMSGGEISGNTASSGGGVYMSWWGGTFTVSGSPVVSDNTNSVGAANNVYLGSERTITVSGLSAGALLGVTTSTAPTESSPVTFATGASAGDEACFFSDDHGRHVERDGNSLLIAYGMIPVPYIDANGTAQRCIDYTVITNSDADIEYGESNGTSWYVVSGDVTINGKLLFLDSNAHLILCDGATLSVTNASGHAIRADGGLAIYGQPDGTGAIDAYGNCGISVHDNLTINGGTVTAAGKNGGGIYDNGGLTINGGSVNATGENSVGIYANSNIVLGWRTYSDSITASSYWPYSGTVSVKDGQMLTDGTTIYRGAVDRVVIAGKTLRPYGEPIPYIDANGDEQKCTNYIIVTSAAADVTYGANGATNWYVVATNVTIGGNLDFADATAHLILCDGATLTVTNASGHAISASSSLILYCQTNGTGAVVANGSSNGISANGSVTINGGNVTATGHYGISTLGDITLGWTTPTASITASSYAGIFTIKPNQVFTDGNNTYSGTHNLYSDETLSAALAGATLRPAFAIAYDLAGGSVATSNPAFYSVASDITLVNPTRDGYLFTGWTGTGLDAPTQTVVIAQGSSGDRAYAANWTPDLATYWHADADHDGTSASRAYVINTTIGLDLLSDFVGENGGKHFVLGWTDSTDSISVGSYGNTDFSAVNISVVPGQLLTDGTNVYSGEITGDQISALAGKTLLPAIPYVDADGDTQYCTNFTVIASAASNVTYGEWGETSWYVVTTNVTINGQLTFNSTTAHLILCDDATFAVTNSGGTFAIFAEGNLAIYGQTEGTGNVTPTGRSYGIYTGRNFTMNGGNLNAASGGRGVFASGVTINGGTVTVNGGTYGITAENNTVTINGSTVNATGKSGDGILAGNVTITDSRVMVNAGNFGINADGAVRINGGRVDITGGTYGIVAPGGLTVNDGIVAAIATVANGKGILTGRSGVTITAGAITATGDECGICATDEGHGVTKVMGGSVTATGNSNGIVCDNFTISGGTVTATGASGCGINSLSVTINGGTLNANGSNHGIIGSIATINGGTVNATGTNGHGISDNTITLGWTNATDSITASSYQAGYVSVKTGQSFTDGTTIYSGTLNLNNDETLSAALAGATLRPAFTIAYDLAGGSVATANPTFFSVASDITLVNPTRDGYLFTGWTGTGLDAPTQTVVIAQGSSGDRAYAANWTPDLATYWHADADHDGTSASRAYVITSTIGLDLLAELVGGNGGKHFVLGWTDSTDSIAVGSYGDNYFNAVDISVNPGQLLTDGTTIYSGTLTGEQIAALAGKTLQPYVSVPYIDANGDTQYCTDFTVITNAASNVTYGERDEEAWYVVGGNVTINGTLQFNSTNHLILCDGATLAVTNENSDAIFASGNLTIYSQASGTGTLIASTSGTSGYAGIRADIRTGDQNYYDGSGYRGHSITINGGTIIADARGDNTGCIGIYASGTVINNGGTVIADARGDYGGYIYYGICASGVTINGGSVTARSSVAGTGAGIYGRAYADPVTINGGSVTATGYKGIDACGPVTINGGNVTADGIDAGIYALSPISINGGNVTANGSDYSGAGIRACIRTGRALTISSGSVTAIGNFAGISVEGVEGNSCIVTNNGGNVYASGDRFGFYVEGNITLGWTDLSDSIYVSRYGATGGVTVKDGQSFVDADGNPYEGFFYNEAIEAIHGKTLRPAVSYIDANGDTQYCSDFIVLTNAASNVEYGEQGAEAWYVVTTNVTIDGTLQFNGSTNHLILCNGATLAVTSENIYDADAAAIFTGGNLAIYGQAGGTGSVTTRSIRLGIYAEEGITINGGSVIDGGGGGTGICANYGDVTINGGTVNVDARHGYGIYAQHGNVTVNGGTVAARGSLGTGIYAYGYGCSVTVNGGTVAATGEKGICAEGGSVTINGGTVNAGGNSVGIHALGGSVTVNGGTVSAIGYASGVYAYGIHADSDVTINGGTVNATIDGDRGDGIHADSDVTINGGNVTAESVNGYEGYGISARGIIYIGWTSSTDSIYASGSYGSYGGYGCSTVRARQLFVDGNGDFHEGDIYGLDIDALAGATLRPAVSYIDANGDTQYCTNFTVITNAASNVEYGELDVEAWYAVTTNITIDGQLAFNGSTNHLILCDGATLNVTNENSDIDAAAIFTGGNLAIYGQANGTGTLIANDRSVGIYVAGIRVDNNNYYGDAITINGGNVTANGGTNGIATAHGITINGGRVTATATYGDGVGGGITINGGDVIAATTYGSGIYGTGVTINDGSLTATGGDHGIRIERGGFTINGGTVTATGGTRSGIDAAKYQSSAENAGVVTINGGTVTATSSWDRGIVGESIVLGWTNPSDSITASSYSDTIRIKVAQVLTDGANVYGGSLTSGQTSGLAGKTLRPAVRIALPDGVVTSGVVTQDAATAYARPGATVTLAAAEGVDMPGVFVNGGPATDNGDGTYSFTASAADITVTFYLPYVDANGDTQYCPDFTVLTNAAGDVAYGESGATNWYVVMSNVTVGGMLRFNDGHAHLIVCDGAALAVTNATGDAVRADGDLSVYGQANGTGALALNGAGDGVGAGGLTVNGGIVDVSGASDGIGADRVTVNGGTVAATGGNDGSGVNAGVEIVLGWMNPADSVFASSYSCSGFVRVKDGKTFVDGDGHTYRGMVNDPAAIAGKTLRPYYMPWALLQAQLDAGGTVTLIGDAVAADDDATLTVTTCVTLDLNGHTITYNGKGAVIRVCPDGDLTLTNSLSAGTVTGGGDHGVYVEGGTFTMTGGTISGNTTTEEGGGVYVGGGTADDGVRYVNGTFTMTGGTISGNTATEEGGGVYVGEGGTFTVSGSPVVSGNTDSVGTANNVYLLPWPMITVDGLSAGASIGVTTYFTPTESSPVTFATGASAGDDQYFFSDDSGCHVERDGSTLQLVPGAIFKDPQGAVIEDSGVIDWLSDNGFTQTDINNLGNDADATDKLYECFLLNCDFTAQDAGGALSITAFAVSNGVVSVTVQLVRNAPLGFIIGHLYLYGANDLSAGFGRSPIEEVSIDFGDDDPSFDIAPNTVPASGLATQSVTATFDVSYVPYRFFKAAIEPFIPNEPEPEPEE